MKTFKEFNEDSALQENILRKAIAVDKALRRAAALRIDKEGGVKKSDKGIKKVGKRIKGVLKTAGKNAASPFSKQYKKDADRQLKTARALYRKDRNKREEFTQEEELVEFTAGLKKHWKKHKQKYVTGLKIAAAVGTAAATYQLAKSGSGTYSSDDKFSASQTTTANMVQLQIDKRKLKQLEKQKSKAESYIEVQRLNSEIDFLKNIIKQREMIKQQRIKSIRDPR